MCSSLEQKREQRIKIRAQIPTFGQSCQGMYLKKNSLRGPNVRPETLKIHEKNILIHRHRQILSKENRYSIGNNPMNLKKMVLYDIRKPAAQANSKHIHT